MTRIIAVAMVAAALLAGCGSSASASELDRAKQSATKLATGGGDPAVTPVILLGQISGTKAGKKQTDYAFAWVAKSREFCTARVNGGDLSVSQCQGSVSRQDIDVHSGSYCSTIGAWGQAGAAVASVELEAGQLVASATIVRVGATGGVDYYAYFVSMNVATTQPIDVTITAKDASRTPVTSTTIHGPGGDC
jgi:hypothetical protein